MWIAEVLLSVKLKLDVTNYATYHDLIYKFVDEHEIRPQIFLFKRPTEVMNTADNMTEKFEGERGYYFSAGGGEDEKQLVSFDVSKLDALSFLYAKIFSVVRQLEHFTYKEWWIGALTVF